MKGILLIEDDINYSKVLTNHVIEEGYRFRRCTTGNLVFCPRNTLQLILSLRGAERRGNLLLYKEMRLLRFARNDKLSLSNLRDRTLALDYLRRGTATDFKVVI